MPYNKQKRRPRRTTKKCRLCEANVKYIDYKDLRNLRDYLTEKGKIVPRRITGNCAHHQNLVKTAIKRARQMGLLPYIKY
jgi:small subunit ribosomal protein S18